MAAPVVETANLTKYYGAKRGIEDVSFEVGRGEVFGFLGPNGAGKTTCMRVLLDLLRPTRGSARIFGLDTQTDAVEIHKRIGFQPAEPGLLGRLSAREHLRYLANLRERAGASVPDERIETLARRLKLDLDHPMAALSRGNRQKVGLVQAFMHEPELLILDEPTGGLDPLMQQEFNRLVRESAAAGRTVFLSSHILPEVESICDRLGIIRDGRMVAVEDMATIKARAVRRVRARYADAVPRAAIEAVDGVRELKIKGDRLTCVIRGEVGPLVRALATPGLVDLVTQEPSLEDVFLGLYQEADA